MRDQMRPFVGTKAVLAMPMTAGEYTEYRGGKASNVAEANAPGRLVEYLDGGKPNDERHEGYISWSPEDVFERIYHESGTIDFSMALAMLKQGHALARTGWNGTDMFVYLVGPGRYKASTPTGEHIASEQADGLVPYKPYLALKCVDGEVVPWLISQTDALAEDWALVLEWAVAVGDDCGE